MTQHWATGVLGENQVSLFILLLLPPLSPYVSKTVAGMMNVEFDWIQNIRVNVQENSQFN